MTNYISVKQISQKLNISLDTAYTWVHMAGFPSSKVGRIIRISEDKLEKWLEERIPNNAYNICCKIKTDLW